MRRRMGMPLPKRTFSLVSGLTESVERNGWERAWALDAIWGRAQAPVGLT